MRWRKQLFFPGRFSLPSGLQVKSPKVQIGPYLTLTLLPFGHSFFTMTFFSASLSLHFPLRRNVTTAWSHNEHHRKKGIEVWVSSFNLTSELSHTSQGLSWAQMDVICLRLHTDFTNNYVMHIHTHSHITTSQILFLLTPAVPKIENGSRIEGTPGGWSGDTIRSQARLGPCTTSDSHIIPAFHKANAPPLL